MRPCQSCTFWKWDAGHTRSRETALNLIVRVSIPHFPFFFFVFFYLSPEFVFFFFFSLFFFFSSFFFFLVFFRFPYSLFLSSSFLVLSVPQSFGFFFLLPQQFLYFALFRFPPRLFYVALVRERVFHGACFVELLVRGNPLRIIWQVPVRVIVAGQKLRGSRRR